MFLAKVMGGLTFFMLLNLVQKTQFKGTLGLVEQLKNESGPSSTIDGIEGHKVTYSQDTHGVISRQMSFWVAKGLSKEEKISIAKSIVYKVSIAHEEAQASFPISWVTDSGFEPSDIPSNMLGVYLWFNVDIDKVKNGDYTEYTNVMNEIKTNIHVYDAETSFKVYQQYPDTFSSKEYKNKTPNPVWFKTEYSNTYPVIPNQYNHKLKPFGKTFKEYPKTFPRDSDDGTQW